MNHTFGGPFLFFVRVILMKKFDGITVYTTYALLIMSYFLSCLIRTSGGVVLPVVSSSIGLSSTAVGLISGMYFYGYTMSQPFCGKMCDDKGPLNVEMCGLVVFTCGLLLFSLAENAFMLCVARFLLGVGAGPTFCGLMVFQAKALPPHLFSKFMGFTIMFGHFGGVVSITPLGSAIDMLGYKNVHYILAIFSVIIIFMLYMMNRRLLFIKSEKEQVSRSSGVLRGFRIIFNSRPLLVVVIVWSLTMILQMNLIGLWGVSWISSACLLSQETARNCMSMGGIGVLAGACIIGCTGNKFSKSAAYLRGFYIIQIISLAALIIGVSYCWQWESLAALTFIIGMTLGIINVLCNIFLFKIVGGDLVGTVTGACNVILFLNVLLSQWFSGAFIQKWNETMIFSQVAAPSAFFALVVVLGIVIFYPIYNTSYKSLDE